MRKAIAKWLLGDWMERLDEAIEDATRVVKQYEHLTERTLEHLSLVDRDVSIGGLAGVLGNLTNCTIRIEPKVYPRIVLSELKLDSALKLGGHHQMVTNSSIQVHEVSVEEKQKE